MRQRSVRKARRLEPVELSVEKLSHEGRGIAHHEGRVVFVDQALPGERVQAAFTNMKGSWAEARTQGVLQRAPERVQPPCPYYEVCGGCSLQHMHSDYQLAFKEAMLHEKLAHSIGHESYRRLPAISSETLGYRRKARLGVRFVGKKERVLVGFRERYSAFIADMQTCAVLDPRVGLLLPHLSSLVHSLHSYRHIPQIEVATGDRIEGRNGVALIFRHLAALPDADLAQLSAFSDTHEVDVYLQPKGPDSVHLSAPRGKSERLHYRLDEFDLTFAFHPTDFTQVNAGVNRRMVSKAIELLELENTDRVLDLFCGLGNFTLPIAGTAAKVVGVEGAASMVERGRENAARNGIVNAEFLCADLTRPPAEHAWLQGGFDKVLLDPPRSGALEVLPAVIAARPARIVYVSCNPATLARDAAVLQDAGYRLDAAGAMDMFPHTAHVESMAVFIHSNNR